MLKESIGVILPKPNKTNYMDCASFRVIVLMQTFCKIAERIINNKLMAIAYNKGLYASTRPEACYRSRLWMQPSRYTIG